MTPGRCPEAAHFLDNFCGSWVLTGSFSLMNIIFVLETEILHSSFYSFFLGQTINPAFSNYEDNLKNSNFIAAPLAIIKDEKHPKCPSRGN